MYTYDDAANVTLFKLSVILFLVTLEIMTIAIVIIYTYSSLYFHKFYIKEQEGMHTETQREQIIMNSKHLRGFFILLNVCIIMRQLPYMYYNIDIILD